MTALSRAALLGLPAVALLLGSGLNPAAAQTTHTVQLQPGFAAVFSPSSLTINEGDTVNWVWVSGLHDVTSFDGAFASGPPVFPPMSFSVTFDNAFVTANGVNGNVYDYFCSVHLSLGMVGSVEVLTGRPTLTVNNLVGGGTASLVTTGATPGGSVGVAFSTAGGGPTMLNAGPCGMVTVGLSNPITVAGVVPADAGGTATVTANVPAIATGVTVWFQALDLSSCVLSNGFAEVVG